MSSIWFITGASSGLGLTLSLRVLEAGHKVVASMRNPSKSKNAVDQIESVGGKVFQLDLSESQVSITEKIHAAERIYGRIDVLINNAGYSVLGPFENFA
jgi:NAD(P)-dependent dehydrogenase (short-subunit alcohol dehydrogenase family)